MDTPWLVSGLVASQCATLVLGATPVLAAILTYVMAEGALAYGAALLLGYALGRGVPVVLAGTFTGVVKRLQAARSWTGAIAWLKRRDHDRRRPLLRLDRV